MSEPRQSLLCDVDGVVADLVGGMRRWLNRTYQLDFDPIDVLYHDRMGRSPGLKDLNEKLKRWFPEEADAEYNGFGGAFRCFMKDREVYGEYVVPINGSVEAIAALRHAYDIVFVTALMKSARDHFRSKMEWIERWFPGIPIITAPSGEKWRVRGNPSGRTYAVDDRFDTCTRWADNGVISFLYRQPWNEAPAGTKNFDWAEIEWALL